MKCVLRTNIVDVFQYKGILDAAPKWLQEALRIKKLKFQGDELWLKHGKSYSRVLINDYIYLNEQGAVQSMLPKMFRQLYTMYYTKEEV